MPSLVADELSTVYLKQAEAAAIADCLDHLPWSSLAWSIHRGMKVPLIPHVLPYMMAYRELLAREPSKFYENGWRNKDFVAKSMAQQAESAVGGDGSCSGDVCRIISAVAEQLWDKEMADMDCTIFWSERVDVPSEQGPLKEVLTPDRLAALPRRCSLFGGFMSLLMMFIITYH